MWKLQRSVLERQEGRRFHFFQLLCLNEGLWSLLREASGAVFVDRFADHPECSKESGQCRNLLGAFQQRCLLKVAVRKLGFLPSCIVTESIPESLVEMLHSVVLAHHKRYQDGTT